jgi:hypothetical protein
VLRQLVYHFDMRTTQGQNKLVWGMHIASMAIWTLTLTAGPSLCLHM